MSTLWKTEITSLTIYLEHKTSSFVQGTFSITCIFFTEILNITQILLKQKLMTLLR